ncbi:MAG: hypothetical protein ACEPOZ_18870 [Marinifilaceae bacterium]
MSFLKDNYRGFIGTTLFHAALFLLLYLLGFSTPLPLPEEEGILVNFGNSNQGAGRQEPAPRRSSPAKAKPKPVPPKKQLAQVQPEKSSPKEKVLTQTHEEAPSLPSAEEIARRKKKKEQAEKRRKEQLERERQRKIEAEKRKQEELQRKREEEAERQRLAELERQRKAEAERQQKIAAINNKAKNIFGKGNTSSTSQSQGKTYTGGNQGKPTGSANSNNYNGTGLGSKGVSYSLAGRNSLSIPKPDYNYQEGGKVVVEVTVDRNGKVVTARPGMPGSTTSNSQLFAAAKKAALKAVFNADSKAAAYQKGTITYHFMLD